MPFPVLREAAAGSQHDPLLQCITVNVWSVGVVGLALPLVLLERLQRRARRAFDLQRRQQRQAGPSSEGELEPLSGLRWLCLASLLSWGTGILLALP